MPYRCRRVDKIIFEYRVVTETIMTQSVLTNACHDIQEDHKKL